MYIVNIKYVCYVYIFKIIIQFLSFVEEISISVRRIKILSVKNNIKMAPVPLEGHQTPVTNNIPQEGNRGGSISLGMLIDFIIQRTYHELTVLAELYVQNREISTKMLPYFTILRFILYLFV